MKKGLANINAHFLEVVLGASVAFVLRGVGAGTAFLLNVAIGRLLGPENAGGYYLTLSVVVTISVVSRMGFDNTLLRFIATSATVNEWYKVKEVFRFAMIRAGVFSMILSILCLWTGPWFVENILVKPELAATIKWGSFTIFSYTVMVLLGESLKGLKHVVSSMFVSGITYSVTALLIIYPLASNYGATGAISAYMIGTIMAGILGICLWNYALRGKDLQKQKKLDHKEIYVSISNNWPISIINNAILPWSPLLLLGLFGTQDDAGILGAATRVAMLVSFLLVAVNNVICPKFSELYTKGDLDLLEYIARRSALFVSFAAAPLLAILMLMPDYVMGLFGSEFELGGKVLLVLAIGQAFNVITGSVGYLLIMTGHERDVKYGSLFSSVVVIGFSLSLIPDYGALGAATASTIAVFARRIWLVIIVWKRLGIMTIPFIPIYHKT